ncbi:MAG: hypothetical protein ACI9QL_004329 [Candidatus Omnitrophota bacterium]|jgi:hypothetical protein
MACVYAGGGISPFCTSEGIRGTEVYRLMELKPGPIQDDFLKYEEDGLPGAGTEFKMLPIKRVPFESEVHRKSTGSPPEVHWMNPGAVPPKDRKFW